MELRLETASDEPEEVFLDGIRALGPLIRAEADASEESRKLTPAVVDALHDAGMFRVFMPRSLGGDERNMSTGLAAIEEIARHDGATGWISFVVSGSPFMLSRLPDRGVEWAFSGPNPFVCGSLFPPGKALAEGDGYRLEGNWSFVSGCQHATVLGLFGLIAGDKGSPPQPAAFVVPARDATILDTWYTGGLRATGSNDLSATNVFVPRERVAFLGADTPRNSHHQGPLYRFPLFGPLGSGVSAVCLGIARNAIDALIEMATEKSPVGRVGKLREQPTIQVDVAKSEAAVRSARAWLYETVQAIEAETRANNIISSELRRDLILASTHATKVAAEAVTVMHLAGGGSAVYTKNPLDRAFRDIHTATQHRRSGPVQFETTGRMLLGLDPDDPLVWQ